MSNDWLEHKKLIEADLHRHQKWLESHSNQIRECTVSLAVLNFKAGCWGGLGGLVVVLTSLVLIYLRAL